MFTIDQIAAVHAKVKSGADFPAYVQDLIRLGVVCYDTYVSDGHTLYQGGDALTLSGPAKYPPLKIGTMADAHTFKKKLKEHQEGKSDYLSFCSQTAACGVNKWAVRMDTMTCTYYDRLENELLIEQIPGG
jgi:uncharacterized protein YbcV (DUF1398 family)